MRNNKMKITKHKSKNIHDFYDHRKNSFIYPNHLDKRNTVALPGSAIAIDLFHLNITNSKKPRDTFKAMIAIDLATGEIVSHALFRLTDVAKGEVPAKKLITPLRHSFAKIHLEKEFIIHVDRGTPFVSKEWHLFIQELGATGSMSEVARPTDNSVAERFIGTIKHQLIAAPTPWPTRVKSLAEIQWVFDQRITFYNHHFRPERACGVTPAQLRPALTAAQHLAPQRVLAYSNHDANHKVIKIFKERSLDSFYLGDHPYVMLKETRDGVKRVEQHNLKIEQKNMQIAQRIDQQLHIIENKIDALHKATRKAPRKRVPLRDPADNTIYNWIMELPRKTHQSSIAFCRFRLAITLLRFTGMRAAEVAAITQPQIETAIKYAHLDVQLAKTHKIHRYVFTQAAREALSRLHVERIQVFQQHTKLAALARPQHWVRFLNENLQPAVQHFGLNIKSHSFRVAYVTHLLKYAPVQQAAAIVGHTDIRSTIAYNRYVPDRNTVIELLERGDLRDS